MKKLMLPLATVVLFSVATFAQTSTGSSSTQGTQSASPSMQQSDTQAGSTGMSGNTANNSEKKIRGCVMQQNGQYVLQTKHGKTVQLSGRDVSSDVGHMVALQGMWTGSAMGTQTSTNAAGSNGSFDVMNVQVISDACSMNNHSGSTGPTPQQ